MSRFTFVQAKLDSALFSIFHLSLGARRLKTIMSLEKIEIYYDSMTFVSQILVIDLVKNLN